MGHEDTTSAAGVAAAKAKVAADKKRMEDAVAAFRTGGGTGASSEQDTGSGVVTASEAAAEDEDDDEIDEIPIAVWQETDWGYISQEAAAQAEAMGMSEWEFSLIMGQTRDKIYDWSFDFVNNIWSQAADGGASALEYYTTDPRGMQSMLHQSWLRFSSLNGMFGEYTGAGGRPSGGRGSGSRGPSAQDIRNRYDVEQLSQQANSIWRNILLTTPKSSRSIAKAYVDEMVRSKGEKALDYQSFVRRKAMDTNRFAVIYEDKPDELEPEAYLGRYAAAAAQIVRPGNVEDIAIEGARIGADSNTFGARLERTDEVTGSSAYINGLENRMRNLNKVFKG